MEHLCKGKHFAQPPSKEKEKLPENRALIKLSEAHTQFCVDKKWVTSVTLDISKNLSYFFMQMSHVLMISTGVVGKIFQIKQNKKRISNL